MDGTVVDERGLDAFRRRHLSPGALLELIERHVHVVGQLAVGVGKSYAVDRLLAAPELYQRFDRVLYVAPTWAILNERQVAREPGAVRSMFLRPRPSDRCGPRDGEWRELERRACSALAKQTICPPCPHRRGDEHRCVWPEQFGEISEHQLLLLPEKQLLINRMLVPLVRTVARAGRVLVILDEARLLDARFEVKLELTDLARLRDVLEAIGRNAAHGRWAATINGLLGQEPLDGRLDLPPGIYNHAVEIQRTGRSLFGNEFYNVSYDLSLLAASRPDERWREGEGIRFVGRPLLKCHVLALSANLGAEYAGDRLGSGQVASPFSELTFRHSGTRIINLRNRIGADRYFRKNMPQVLDLVAVLIARNIEQGRSTLLISRKKTKALCVDYLAQRVARWGYRVQFVCEKFDGLPEAPAPTVIPVIHYGTLGVNSFADYECAYCLNSYYISPETLARPVQEASPKQDHVRLGIISDGDRVRRPVVLEGAGGAGVIAKTARIYLDKLELDPVVQAIGRVRYATRPREVVVFQMADLTVQLGEHEVVRSLAELRGLFAIPRAHELDVRFEGQAFAAKKAAGATVAEIAAEAGVSKSTVHRRLASYRALKSPSSSFLRGNDSPCSRAGGCA